MASWRVTRFVAACAVVVVPAVLAQSPQKAKLPKPKQLDADIAWRRDTSTGEIEAGAAASAPAEAAPVGSPRAISVSTEIVPVTCSVTDAMGAAVRGLTREDFQIYDRGVLQSITYFDASAEPASVALVMDASPSVLRDVDEMRAAARALVDSLSGSDQIAVVDFSAHTYLQLPFSGDWGLIRAAVSRVDARKLLGDTGGSSIYESLFLVQRELFHGRKGRKAIVLLTDGQDTSLGLTLDPATAGPRRGWPSNRLTFEDVARSLAGADIQLFAVSTESRPKIMTAAWVVEHASKTLVTQEARREEIPAYTLYLAEMARRTGGQLYFIREANTLADTFQQIALKIRAEYTLGFSPAGNAEANGGWHELDVRVIGHGDPKVVHRAAYYVPGAR
jgi:Ca-activated chloride channel family protein